VAVDINNSNVTRAVWRDYLELTKPNVVALMILTAWVGMLLAVPAGSTIPIDKIIFATIGIGFCASSAACVNHIIDKHIDTKMNRTKFRPVAKGRVSEIQAIVFSLALGVIGLAVLIYFINQLTAWMTLITLLGYALFYTVFLKHATPQNIVIGGAAGAAPPLLGWSSITGTIDPYSLLLVLIIFAWTPPHFWALAIYRRKEYSKANIPMLPVTHGVKFTKLSIVLYTLLLILSTLLPYITGLSGIIYLICTTFLNILFLYQAVQLYFSLKEEYALRVFSYSIIYLMALFIALLVDHYYLFKIH
jgi:heme o synthase